MKNLTLPIEIGKRYVRRDGVVITAQKPLDTFVDDVCYVGGELQPTDVPHDVVWIRHGGVYSGSGSNPHDLVADYVELPEVNANPAAFLDKYRNLIERVLAGEQFEWLTGSGQWVDTNAETMIKLIAMNAHELSQWRVRKRKVFVGDVELVYLPMSVAPVLGETYWFPAPDRLPPVASHTWDNGAPNVHHLANNLVHDTYQGAEAHGNALLAATKVK